MNFSEEELRLTVRQVEDLICQADRILEQPFNSSEIDSLDKFAGELKEFPGTRTSNSMISELLLRIPIIGNKTLLSAESGWSIRSFVERGQIESEIREMRDVFSS